MPDKKANIFEVRNLSGRHGLRCGGHKYEGGCILPGEICRSAVGLPGPTGVGMDRQKSALSIVLALNRR